MKIGNLHIKNWQLVVGLGLLGVLGGLFYYEMWGCTKGCKLDSSWTYNSFRGGVLGMMLAWVIIPSKSGRIRKQQNDQEENRDEPDTSGNSTSEG